MFNQDWLFIRESRVVGKKLKMVAFWFILSQTLRGYFQLIRPQNGLKLGSKCLE